VFGWLHVFLVVLFLCWGVGFFSKSTWFHKHKIDVSTWMYAVLVVKTPVPTPKQPIKNKQKPKQNALFKPSCGCRKTTTLTQREKTTKTQQKVEPLKNNEV
jgi:hypothetical protein